MKINANIRTETLKAVVYKGVITKNISPEIYGGEYEIVPKTEAQKLNTANKLLEENIKVLAIPFYEVSNKDGITAIIAD